MIEAKQWLFFDLGSTLIDEDEYLSRRDALLHKFVSKDIAPANALEMITIRIRRGMDFGALKPKNRLKEADFEIEGLEEIDFLLA